MAYGGNQEVCILSKALQAEIKVLTLSQLGKLRFRGTKNLSRLSQLGPSELRLTHEVQAPTHLSKRDTQYSLQPPSGNWVLQLGSSRAQARVPAPHPWARETREAQEAQDK